jgi:hypothetical protein
MTNAKLQTQATVASVAQFLGDVEESRRTDCLALVKILQRATKAKPKIIVRCVRRLKSPA